MTTTRQRRVAEVLKQKLSELLLLEMNDPRLAGVTITDVLIDRELSYADIYVNALGDEERREDVLAAMQRAAGFMRHRLGGALDLRRIPELRFAWDDSFEQAERIDQLLDSLGTTHTSEEDAAEHDEDD